jgi:hypothetical protein
MPRKVLTAAAPEPHHDESIQVEVTLPVRHRRGETHDQSGSAPKTDGPLRIPRITRLMALAIKFQEMVNGGEVRDYADIARLGYVTRARLTQVMNLLLLAPDIQDEILGWGVAAGQKVFAERHVRSVVKFVLWEHQRQAWRTT